LPLWVDEIAWGVEENCNAWRDMDNGVFHGAFLLKHFEVFGPPGPGGGGRTCGPGTHEEDSVCLPDPVPPPTCPAFILELTPIDATTAQARCVEVQE
jgi:hypothetical protein